jgi:hypothetical protein
MPAGSHCKRDAGVATTNGRDIQIRMTQIPIIAALLKYADRLKFRQLFLLTASLFILDLLIPDIIPFADEILLGLLTLLFGSWRKTRPQASTTIEHTEQGQQ